MTHDIVHNKNDVSQNIFAYKLVNYPFQTWVFAFYAYVIVNVKASRTLYSPGHFITKSLK